MLNLEITNIKNETVLLSHHGFVTVTRIRTQRFIKICAADSIVHRKPSNSTICTWYSHTTNPRSQIYFRLYYCKCIVPHLADCSPRARLVSIKTHSLCSHCHKTQILVIGSSPLNYHTTKLDMITNLFIGTLHRNNMSESKLPRQVTQMQDWLINLSLTALSAQGYIVP